MKGYDFYLTSNFNGIKHFVDTIDYDCDYGKPRDYVPKTYKKIGGFIREHGTYEEGWVHLYKNKRGQIIMSSYYDGCFCPIYSKVKSIRVIEMYNEDILSEKYKKYMKDMYDYYGLDKEKIIGAYIYKQ